MRYPLLDLIMAPKLENGCDRQLIISTGDIRHAFFINLPHLAHFPGEFFLFAQFVSFLFNELPICRWYLYFVRF